MREIKFRAFNTLYGMSEGKSLSEWINKGKEALQLDDTKLMQFTGLKDKNGNDIYEGDIVKFSDNTCGHIVWETELPGFVAEECGGTEFLDLDPTITKSLDTSEIIGNIYENPEFLNKKSI